MLKYSLNQFLIKVKITTTDIYSKKNAHINQLKNNHKISFCKSFKSLLEKYKGIWTKIKD